MELGGIIADIIMIANRSHADLENLTADDHKQYLDVAGTRPPTKVLSGNTAAKPATPAVGDIYWDTQVEKLYLCKTAESWTQAIPKLHAGWHADDGADPFTAEQMADLMLLVATSQGDILIRGASTVERLAAGVADKTLTSHGAGNNPTWETPVVTTIGGGDFLVSDNLRNSNDTEKKTSAPTYYKIKETLLNADLNACRIKMDIKVTGGVTGYIKIYKNGSEIGQEFPIGSQEFSTRTEDFTDWVSGDLIQIYGKISSFDVVAKNFRFYYDQKRAVSKIGGEELTTALPTTGYVDDPTISMTHNS